MCEENPTSVCERNFLDIRRRACADATVDLEVAKSFAPALPGTSGESRLTYPVFSFVSLGRPGMRGRGNELSR